MNFKVLRRANPGAFSQDNQKNLHGINDELSLLVLLSTNGKKGELKAARKSVT